MESFLAQLSESKHLVKARILCTSPALLLWRSGHVFEVLFLREGTSRNWNISQAWTPSRTLWFGVRAFPAVAYPAAPQCLHLGSFNCYSTVPTWTQTMPFFIIVRMRKGDFQSGEPIKRYTCSSAGREPNSRWAEVSTPMQPISKGREQYHNGVSKVDMGRHDALELEWRWYLNCHKTLKKDGFWSQQEETRLGDCNKEKGMGQLQHILRRRGHERMLNRCTSMHFWFYLK